jgi:hypothetical protein
MEDLIRKNYSIALSLQDLKKICNGKVNIFLYTDLAKAQHIDELFHPYGCFIVLYQQKPNYGHWVTVNRVDKNTIEHFDPYGIRPDEEFKNHNPMNLPLYLSTLITNSGYERTIYNQYQLQGKDKNVATCGRWAAVRVLMRKKRLSEFTDLFHGQKLEPDFYVTAITLGFA